MSFDLDGRVVIVTGAARGQGAAEAELLADLGARVVVTDVLRPEGEAVAAALGDRARFVPLDVSDEEAWAGAVEVAERWGGRLDGLVNNAGLIRPAPLLETTLDSYLAHVSVNQVGVFLGLRAVTPAMTRAGGGSIVNIASAAATIGVPGLAAYCASKWAVRGMTKSAAIELAPRGIRVNTVLPGSVDTPMLRADGMDAADVEATYGGLVPTGRVGQPEDVAWLVAFLLSDRSAYCNGGDYVVDGARTVGVTSPLAARR